MTKKRAAENGLTSEENSLTSDDELLNVIDMANVATNDTSLTKPMDSQIEEKPGQTKPRKSQTTSVKWSITTEKETRTIANKAASKAGMKLYDWIDQTLSRVGIEELTHKPQPPAKTEDLVKDIVSQFAERFEASQEAARQAQNAVIEQQAEQIAELTKAIQGQPRSFKEMLFGRKDH